MVDKNARNKNAPIDLEEQEFYGEIKYYFAHEYIKDKDKWILLAFVQWITIPIASSYDPLIFHNLDHSEIINVNAITRSIRFFSISKNRHYIIDQEDYIIHTDK